LHPLGKVPVPPKKKKKKKNGGGANRGKKNHWFKVGGELKRPNSGRVEDESVGTKGGPKKRFTLGQENHTKETPIKKGFWGVGGDCANRPGCW